LELAFDLNGDRRNNLRTQNLYTMSLIKFRTNPAQTANFDSFFNDFFEGEFFPKSLNHKSGSLPAANIRETETGFHVELAAPGMKKEDFNIELNEDLLSIRTEKQEEQEEKDGKYTKREFNYSSFVRSFRLPEEVDIDSIRASYSDGLLSLDIPKKEMEETKKVKQIEIK